MYVSTATIKCSPLSVCTVSVTFQRLWRICKLFAHLIHNYDMFTVAYFHGTSGFSVAKGRRICRFIVQSTTATICSLLRIYSVSETFLWQWRKCKSIVFYSYEAFTMAYLLGLSGFSVAKEEM